MLTTRRRAAAAAVALLALATMATAQMTCRASAEPQSLRYYGAANYWPPGFYVAPWPAFAVLGPTHAAMVLTNLLHLALLGWSTVALGTAVSGPRTGLMALGLLPLYPSVFGNLVRYEPSLALMAWVTFAALCVLRSEELTRPRWSLGFALACCAGLMMDRLSFGFFLVWPVLLCLRRRESWTWVGMSVAVVALLTGWWHWNFVELHLSEVVSQQSVGEIDSTGTLTQEDAKAPLLYYALILVDSQAGLAPGLLGLASLLLLRRSSRVPAVVVLGSVAAFTLITKKQAFYTLPMLGCLAVLSADALRGRWGPVVYGVVLVLGLDQHAARLWDRGLLPAVLNRPALPEAWVLPRHPQALPPRRAGLPLDAVASACPDVGQTVVFSDDSTWFEGFVVLGLRERNWPRTARGLIGDPSGTYEWFEEADCFVHVTDAANRWPATEPMEAALRLHNYAVEELPPAIEVMQADRLNWREVQSWPLSEGGRVTVWGRHE